MRKHLELGPTTFGRLRMLSVLIGTGEISLGGNCHLKIYGRLTCASGKRLKPQNRVFFKSEEEALRHGYRPCGHCMPKEYQDWKKEQDLQF
ncbi:Ada metal-binding domain-containing protein [Runella salmonicolor]|uniref:Metal-binding protein n=1 Tax=Runella salmonicolor TaxID=2950278 RepID=A0ABT1FGY2_9BACT|nr:Ada metal-binding domain-containing protein [Runella salmonicolor]MCP1381008.1 metal-binding protein [Runella salmonicolor]